MLMFIMISLWQSIIVSIHVYLYFYISFLKPEIIDFSFLALADITLHYFQWSIFHQAE